MCSIEFGTFFLIAMNDNVASATPPVQARIFLIDLRISPKAPPINFTPKRQALFLTYSILNVEGAL